MATEQVISNAISNVITTEETPLLEETGTTYCTPTRLAVFTATPTYAATTAAGTAWLKLGCGCPLTNSIFLCAAAAIVVAGPVALATLNGITDAQVTNINKCVSNILKRKKRRESTNTDEPVVHKTPDDTKNAEQNADGPKLQTMPQ